MLRREMADLDAQLFRVIQNLLTSSESAIDVMLALSFIGSGWAMFALLPFIAIPRTRHASSFFLATLVATAIAVQSSKQVFQRMRPYRRLVGVQCFASKPPTDYSFPSGHASGAFAFAVFLVTLLIYERAGRTRGRIAISVGILVLAAGICFSRIGLGVHFPGDVAVGALLGGTIGHLGARVYLRRKGPQSPGAVA